MMESTLDSSVPDRVIEPPLILVVFQTSGVDYCCGENRWSSPVENKDLKLLRFWKPFFEPLKSTAAITPAPRCRTETSPICRKTGHGGFTFKTW